MGRFMPLYRVGWLRICAVSAGILLASSGPLAWAQTTSDEVTFSGDIAPILQEKCQACHQPGSIAPMSLITYEEVRPWARAIKAKTGMGPRSGVMPPWYVDKTVGIQEILYDPSLSEQEIQTIARWVDSGAPPGNPVDMPPPRPPYNDDWAFEPDLIVQGPLIEVPAAGSDWWGDLGLDPVPTGMTEDRYVAAVQMKEVTVEMEGDETLESIGGRFVLHHIGFSTRRPGDDGDSGQQRQSADGLCCRGVLHEVGRNEDVLDPEVGHLLPEGSSLHIGRGAHLHPNGRRTKARLDIAFKFHPKDWKPTKTVRNRGLFGNTFNIDLRPMEANQTVEALTVLDENVRIVSFEPHMHAAGVRICLSAYYGAGATEETLSCVGYDHSWVRTYNFAKGYQPLLPRGTILRMTGYFDNTPGNPNVADPRNWSGSGHRSIDNMMNQLGDLQLLTDEEFQAAMRERREALGLAPGEAPLGCPLCGVVSDKPATSATTQQEQQ